MNLRRWFVLFALIPVVAWAEPGPTFEVFKIARKQRQPFAVEQSMKWVWRLNKEKVRVLAIQASFKSPEFSNYKKARTRGRSARAIVRGDTLIVRFNSLRERIVLKGTSGKLKLEIRGKFENENPVVDKNCSRFDLAFVPHKTPVPFYVGISCDQTDRGLSFALSYPRRVRSGRSTLVESRGKGESWKYYELGRIKRALEVVGEFTLEYKKKRYEFSLEPVKAVKATTKIRRILLSTGLGYSLLNISELEPERETSDSKPSLFVRVPHYSIKGNWGVALNLDLALPLSSADVAVSYTQLEMFAAYEFLASSSIRIRPQIGYVVSFHTRAETITESEVALNVKQIAFGVAADIDLGANYHLGIKGMTCGVGSDVVTSHYALDINVLRYKGDSIGFGLGGRLQSFSTVSPLGVERQFSQTMFYGLVAF